MDVGFRTPLLDFFREGEVARDVRLQAAHGALPTRAHEQMALLVLLTGDSDSEIVAAAEATLAKIPPASLSAFLARSDVPAEMREFFAKRGVAAGDTPAPEADAPQKMSRATKGTREERAILIRDPNKLIAVAVLSSPKLTDSEVEAIAKMSSVSDEILRIIARNRNWVKNYVVVSALARNPKTPLPISMNLLSRLNEKDLRMLSQDRNVPDVLRITARKKIVLDKK